MSLLDTRDTGDRGFTTERYVEPMRDAIAPRSIAPDIIYDRYVDSPREAIQPRQNDSRGFSIVDDAQQNAGGPQTTSPTNNPVNNTPSQTFGGALQGLFGGGGRNYDNPITVVPAGEESASNSNLGLILLVVAIGGGAAYWYYKKGGFNA